MNWRRKRGEEKEENEADEKGFASIIVCVEHRAFTLSLSLSSFFFLKLDQTTLLLRRQMTTDDDDDDEENEDAKDYTGAHTRTSKQTRYFDELIMG